MLKILQSIIQKLNALVKGVLFQHDGDLRSNPTRKIGTIIIALSGLLLYMDKAFVFFNIDFVIPETFTLIGWDFQTFIWYMAQTLSPLLLIFGGFLKPHKVAYIVPLYCYLLQLYYVLFDFKIIDDGNFAMYTLGSSLLVIILIQLIKRISLIYITKQIHKEKERIKNELSKN